MERAFALVLSSLCVIGCPRTDAADSVPTVSEPEGKEAAAKEESVTGIKVGNVAPDFEVKDEAGNIVKLSQHRGKQPVLLAFYPKDFTGG
jgi:cytochrome oxidase Cu insertion factor (SCO1/SenC/PrrC family)